MRGLVAASLKGHRSLIFEQCRFLEVWHLCINHLLSWLHDSWYWVVSIFQRQALSKFCGGFAPAQTRKSTASRWVGHKFLKRIFSNDFQPLSAWSFCDAQEDSWMQGWTCKFVWAFWCFVWLRSQNWLHSRLIAFSFLTVFVSLQAWTQAGKS